MSQVSVRREIVSPERAVMIAEKLNRFPMVAAQRAGGHTFQKGTLKFEKGTL